MTAPGYQAAPAAMHDAADGIDGLVGELRTLTTAGRAGEGRGVGGMALDPDQFGHDELAGAFATFCARWEWGVRSLVQSGADMAEGLRESMRAYEKTEDDVGSVFSRLLSDAVGDPKADPEQASHRTPQEAMADVVGDSPQAWVRSAESATDAWSALGTDARETMEDRLLRSATGRNPVEPEIDALGEIVD